MAVHSLELELTARPPANLRNKADLDNAVSRAQKRMTQAIGELARLRRLQVPLIVSQLMVPVAEAVNSKALPAEAARS